MAGPDSFDVVFSTHNNRHLTDKVDYPPQWRILIMKSFFHVESIHRKKIIDCMWNIQRMSFYVENLHLTIISLLECVN